VEAKLIPLHIGLEKQINIFIHGYGSVSTNEEFNVLVGSILSAQPAGRVYLMFWKSGCWKFPPWVLAAGGGARALNLALAAAAAEFAIRIAHFKFFESKAEQLGRRFLRHLSKIPHAREYPINLIGFSLGARVVHYALATNDLANYRVRDVILLGGAADAKDEDWPECAEKIKGKIYNAWSPDDFVLKWLKPDLRSAIGRHGILWRHPKIVNRRYKLGHDEYWFNLEYLLSRLWPRFVQAKKPLINLPKDVKCPYCGKVLVVFPPWDDFPIECGVCGLDFEFNGKTVYMIENDIECPKCGHIDAHLPEEGYVSHCGKCGTAVWDYGDRMT
jgi:transcription elongation factor Elf1